MLTAIALCPSAPLLDRALTGLDPVVPVLRDACAAAVRRMLDTAPDAVLVIGPADRTQRWDVESAWDTGPFTGEPSGSQLPFPVGLGRMLLRDAGYGGSVLLQSVAEDASVEACVELGEELSALPGRLGAVVLADGSARRTEKAPGHFDARAEGLDAEIDRAVRAGDLEALLGVEPRLAAELMAAGRSSLQVVAGAAARCLSEVLYSDAPFGVAYTVAVLRC